jgi:phosphohistidine phosphatase SixA
MKAASSGGDSHKVRNNYENEQKIINRATMFLLANDMLPITPSDSGVKTRCRFIRYKLRFVSNPTSPDERQADTSIKSKFAREEWKDALFFVMVDSFQEMNEEERKKGGQTEPPACVLEETAEWIGDDGDRPLDNRGQIQSEKFKPIYEAYGVDEIFSSDAYRCLETVKPLGRDLGITVGIASDISEYQYSRDKEKPLKFAKKFLKASKDGGTPKTVLLCSHNPVLPKILKELAGVMAVDEIDIGLEPGDGWVLFHRDGKVKAINFIQAP